MFACFFLLLSGGAAWAQGGDGAKSFVMADVHRSEVASNPFLHGGSVTGDRYFLKQATMVDLISTAYGVDADNVTGGPPWLERDRYDLQAKVPPHTSVADAKRMLRGLLVERFKLVVKEGSAPMPAYAVSLVGGKTTMAQSDGTGEAACVPQPPAANAAPAPGTIVVKCNNITMEAFVQTLHMFGGEYFPQPLVDATELKGAYDFTLQWTFKQQMEKAGAAGIPLPEALKKQLGLKVELTTAPRPVFLVASVEETPTPSAPGVVEALPEPASPEFEVVTIKPSAPDEKPFGRITGNGAELRNFPLRFMMQFGWNLNQGNSEAVVGAPKWIDVDKFDIVAKAGAGVRVDVSPMGPLINYEDMRAMIRAMLADRFKMKTHMETRLVTAYTLVAVNPKLKQTADPTERTKCKEGPGPDGKDPRTASPELNRLLSCQNMTMAQIGEELQRVANGYIYGTVEDRTGLKGSYDFTLSFSSADKMLASPAANGGAADPNGAVSVFDAVSRQLGLKLEKEKRPSQVLVIDHIEEKPTDN